MRFELLMTTACFLTVAGCQQPQEAASNEAGSAGEQADIALSGDRVEVPDRPVSSDDALQPSGENTDGAPSAPARPTPKDCPIISSEGWGAWIEKNGEENILTVSGRVTLPSAGYRTSLVFGETREINPPGQTIKLIVTASPGASTQVVTEKEVVEQFNGLPAYSDVTITCGGRTIGRVDKVVTTLG